MISASRKLRRTPAARIRRALTPARLLVLSFLSLIAAGTVGLMTLPGLYTDEGLSWLDALFTAVSAVCVTGLIVVDTATHFTVRGQAFILLLIQLGGLGILTFTTLVIVTLGRRISLHHEAVTATTADIAPDVDYRMLVRDIVRFTLAFEAVGALLLFMAFLPVFGVRTAAWHAVFQSVSAFCNAGFSTFTRSLMDFQTSPMTLLTVMALIVLGGLGFLTLEELRLRWRRRTGPRLRLSLHSRLVLATTALVLVGGWGLLCLLEWSRTLADLPMWAKLLNGLFMSVTARTAGFNTVDYATTGDPANFVTILLMSIGGSPGSTAGGLKTTTVAVLLLLAISRLRGLRTTSVQGRTVPDETVQRAVGLFVVGFAAVTLAILLYNVMQLHFLGATAEGRFLHYMFEAVSAFNTVGLSMGATSELGTPAKWLTIVLMYVGRVGPLTFVASIALQRRSRAGGLRYASEDVIIG